MRKKYEVIYKVNSVFASFIPTNKRHINFVYMNKAGEPEYFMNGITVYERSEAQRIFQEAIKQGYEPTIVEK